MALFAPSPVVRLEFRSNSCEIERSSISTKKSLGRNSFETPRSMTGTLENTEKCWSWSVKNDLLPQPQLQNMRDSHKPVFPFFKSFPSSSSSRQSTVSRFRQQNSSPRLYFGTNRDEPPSDTSIRTHSPESKRKSDVPSLTSDESRTSFDSSIGSPQQSPCRVSFSRPFVNGTPPKFTNPCDKQQGVFEEADGVPSRMSRCRTRPLIPIGIAYQNDYVSEPEKLVHSPFDFEHRQCIARKSLDAETIFSEVTRTHSIRRAVAESGPGVRGVSPHFPICQDASKYITRPLPAVPISSFSINGNPQRCAQRMRERRKARSSSLPSAPTTPIKSEKSTYNLFPSPPRATERIALVSPVRRNTGNSRPFIEGKEDRNAETSFHSTSTSVNTSFSSESISSTISFNSDAIAKSYREMSIHLREIFLNDDFSYALSLFPTPPTNTVT